MKQNRWLIPFDRSVVKKWDRVLHVIPKSIDHWGDIEKERIYRYKVLKLSTNRDRAKIFSWYVRDIYLTKDDDSITSWATYYIPRRRRYIDRRTFWQRLWDMIVG